MYKKVYEELIAQLGTEAIPTTGGGGLIGRPTTNGKKESDPLAISKDWIATIKASGEHFRKNIKATRVKEFQKQAKKEEAVKAKQPIAEEPLPKPAEAITNRPSMFDGVNIDGSEADGNFSLPKYDGGENNITSLVRAAAQKYGLPEDIALRLARQESGFKQNVTSSAGAIGVMQLMPGTAQELGVDPYDTAQNIDGGMRYLKQQYDTFGTWEKTLAAYNAGPGAVKKYNGVPPYKETQNYVRSILGG